MSIPEPYSQFGLFLNMDYKDSETYKQYNSLHVNDQIPFLRENNEVLGDLEYWLIIKNKFHANRITCFTKFNSVVYREDLAIEPNGYLAILEVDGWILERGYHLCKQYINSWNDRSITRFHFHIEL